MKENVLLIFGVIIEVDKEELEKDHGESEELANKISDAINHSLGYKETFPRLGWTSTSFTHLDPKHVNCGRCANCNGWVTDVEKPGRVGELCNGATVDGRLLCDECLPKGHRWAF